ncbi:hypothetical protein WEN_02785 [Mycoplasma wenyonii str. Massachusetts]|uniref:Uncharacterized protein n=1 Tax=Mycoplasma wenyonii (strain Massachusetts) TaxID=1197325 RepID=I6ZJG8_MYCWM|nr:hypothetical protein [Mycoplasma wenyonii]AFN65340.1 hypothetical protein WEN_02785 [Mycoplasma wenyonii str. Massachusetts]
MGNPLFLGKLIIAGAGGTPVLYFGLMNVTSHKNREYKIEVDLGEGNKELAKTQDSLSTFGDRYQGFLVQSACFNKPVTFEDAFAIVFRLGDGKSKNIWREYALEGVIGVRRKGLRLDWTNPGGSGWIKEDIWNTGEFGLIAYESQSGSGMILWAKGKPVGEDFKLNSGKQAETNEPERLVEQIQGKQIKVRRSVKGIWGEVADQGEGSERKCKPAERFAETDKVIYKNYGMLQADGIPVKDLKVLDWVHWGSKEIKNTEKLPLKQKSYNGRYDYYELGEKITKVISGSLKDMKVNEKGISDGKGNLIKWSDSFKPTITLTLDK